MKKEHLASTFDFALDGVTDDSFIVTVNRGVDRDFARDGGIDGGHVPCSHE